MTESDPPVEPAVADTAPLVGVVLDGRYRVLKPLGEGGMGAVFLTRDLRLERDVVIKVPHASQALTAGFRQRFRKEIQSLTTLDHPNIVKVLDMGETSDGVPYAVMPYLAGGSMKERLEALKGPPSVELLGAWLAPIADALDSIHRKGFVHRDVKPSNLLFDEEGHPYLADFGIVKVLHSGETSLTQSGFMPGSPQYMAPEAVSGLEAGPAYDQYSLGAVAYEALTGSLPITGLTAVELLVKKRSDEARPIDESRPDLPVPLKKALMRSLARDPTQRFSSCAEMVTAAGLAVPDLTRSVAVITQPKLPSGLDARPLWRRRWGQGAAAALAAAGIGWGAWSLLGGGPSGPPPRLAWLEPVEGQVAFHGERVRLRLKTDGLEPGDVLRVDGEPRAGARGWLNALVDVGTGAGQDVMVSVVREGDEVARAVRRVTLEPVPRLEVPEWARISREQLLEARRIGVPVAFENALGMRFVLVPGGTFEMGPPEWDPYRRPTERIAQATLTSAWYAQITHVTNAQLRRWKASHHNVAMMDQDRDGEDSAATSITHDEALAFAAWVSGQDPTHAYGLPVEAEWERATRAGTRGYFWWGDDPLQMGRNENSCDRSTVAHFKSWKGYGDVDDGFPGDAPVGALAPNAWGLFDPAGSVKVWCADDMAWEKGIPPLPRAFVEPRARGTGRVRCVRGGTWIGMLPVSSYRSAYRGGYTAEGRDPDDSKDEAEWIGLRLVARVASPPHPGSGDEPVVLVIEEPLGEELALEGQWIRVRARVEGWRAGDEVRVDGETRALLQGQLHALVPAGKHGTRTVEISVQRAGIEIARATREVGVEAVPRPEVPDWAPVSREQLLEARRFGVPVAFENPLGMRFLLIPSGSYVIGSPTWEPGRSGCERQGRVTLTRPYYLQATEVTLAQVQRWRPEHVPESLAGETPDQPDHPATGLTHPESREFAAWVATQDVARVYALPDEARWEIGARGGMPGQFWWGEDFSLAGRMENLCDRTTLTRFVNWKGDASIDDGIVGYAKTGSLATNPYGLHDMIGNVSEWCADALPGRSGSPPCPVEATDPVPATTGDTRAMRGTCWNGNPVATWARAAARGYYEPDGTDPVTNFRLKAQFGLRLMVPVNAAPLPPAPAPERPPTSAPEPTAAAPTLTVESPLEGQLALDDEWVHVRARIEGLAAGDVVEVNGVVQTLSGPYAHTGLRMKGPAARTVEVRVKRGREALLSERRTLVVEPVPRPEVPGWARISKRQLDEARRSAKPVAFEDDLGLRFVLIPAGEFDMGSPEWERGRDGRETLHRVRFTRPYYLAATETTNALVRRHRPEHTSGAIHTLTLDDDAQPALRLTFEMAEDLTRWLNARSLSYRYRLPTEAEWEHAARAGSMARFPWGEDESAMGRFANVADQSARERISQWTVLPVLDGHAATAPVGTLESNAWGVSDTLGNAVEWTADWFALDLAALPAVDPSGPASGEWRGCRGGCFTVYAAPSLRTARRVYLTPAGVEPESGDNLLHMLGVRLVAEPR